MRANIMFVDDSSRVLESLKWIFMDEPYYPFSFDSPLDALSVIKAIEFAVVVADQWMQEMDGLEFLKRVKRKSPDTVGIIMTGYMELDSVQDAINQGYVYRFVKKPLYKDTIKQAVEMAITCYEINTEGCGRIEGRPSTNIKPNCDTETHNKLWEIS